MAYDDEYSRVQENFEFHQDESRKQFYRALFLFISTVLCGWIMKYCNKRIGTGDACYKLTRWFFVIYNLVILLLYLLACRLGADKVNMPIVYIQIGYIVFGTLLRKNYVKKIPIVCCGRRKCCFCKQTKRSIGELLYNIDQHVLTEDRLPNMQIECRNKGANQFKKQLENQFSNQKIGILFTGSSVERFGVPTSADLNSDMKKTRPELITDFDLMLYFKDMQASENGNTHFNVVSNDDRLKPGFVYLSLTDYGYHYLTGSNGQFIRGFDQLFPTYPEKRELSAMKIKDILYDTLSETKLDLFPQNSTSMFPCCCCGCCSWGRFNTVQVTKQGPAVNVVIGIASTNQCQCNNMSSDGFLTDFTFGIKTVWPSISDWENRPGRKWPSRENVDRIIRGGSHLVPKSQYGDTLEETWRFSFSKAEVELSKLINPIARKCFLALKIISKNHLRPMASWLKSYHLKTLLFNTLEKTPLEFWCIENLEPCFLCLMAELRSSVESQFCQHFWISSINLFDIEPKVSENKFKKLLKRIDKIMLNPHWYIAYVKPLDEGPSFNYQRFDDEINHDEITMTVV